ncbi:GDSL-type esterase/lipase family protein [Lachnoclostridium pacaense]|uniref:GDSL-type esterase/lipase family protein n=1 Tax=Enterocloster hominis (ex Hitch et al. 2024) TaxID=1917870 RepID=UPI001D10416C|nr:GDSL-type esterase/lipase family protein [Lachnoclostridium pacaense]MCC2876093.1 GDSL-type esterase/lipase family protein [Lachnoclostridium pacaense]
MKRYSYSIFLFLSIVIMALTYFLPGRAEQNPNQTERLQVYPENDNQEAESPAAPTVARQDSYEGWEASSEEAAPMPEETGNEGTVSMPEETNDDGTAAWPEAADDFSGTLFIGDSRTAGLSEYGDFGEAEVFANSGMSVFNLFDEKVKLRNGTKTGLEELLSSQSYQNIYIMLGINELGYDFSSIVTKYQSMVEKIKELQPSAVIILEANLHVTSGKSSQSSLYNNEKINLLNSEIANIAAATGSYYIDVNGIFDDASGNLAAEYSSDGSHVLGKYYSVWVEWIRGGQ